MVDRTTMPSGYKWVPKTKMKWVPKVRNENVQKRVSFAIDNASRITNIVQLILFIVDSGCIKHMTGNLTLLCNFVEKYMGTVHFGNDQFALILRYGDLVQGNIMINRVYYVEGLNHNHFLVGQFCDADLEVAFQKSTCFIRDLQGTDLLIDNLSKAKRSSFKTKTVPSSKGQLNLLNMDLCGPMRVARINGNKYILLIIDDYSRYTWTLFFRSKDETPEVLKDFLMMIQRNLQALVIFVRTDRGTEFLNKTLNAFFKEEGIEHQTSTLRTPEWNGIVERRNRTLVEAARTMLSASKLPLFFWAEAITTACYTQNRSIIIPTHEKTAYHIINDRKPLIKHIHIFSCTCYLTRYGENLDKIKEKGDLFDEIKEMSKTSVDTTVPSQQELDLLFGPLYYEFFNAGTSRVNKSSSPIDNSAQQDTLPSMNIHPTSEPSTPTNVYAEENNNNQAEDTQHKFTNPFCTSLVQTRQQLATNPEMCMFALTVSTAEPKNIKEAMADSAWIDAMHEELH
ncbi:retrovirus-related pol polyprotein from transposon TNT 1-94 [Tanacetum coccineum]